MTYPLEPDRPTSPWVDDRQMALIIYILFLAPLGGLTHIIGLIMAYVTRESAPPWLQTHYTWMIRTFWIGLVAFAISGLLCLILIGFVLVPLVIVWLIVRTVVGLMRLFRGEAIANPQSWFL